MVTWPETARIVVAGLRRRRREDRVVGGEQAVESGEPFDGREERAQVVGVGGLPTVGG